MNEFFRKFAHITSEIVGSPWAFIIAIIGLIIWVISGPVFNYSDTWQLIVNTSTTIITFLMVFLIQNTQNRDAKAMNIKIDELIRATKQASNKAIDLENKADEELEAFHEKINKNVHRHAHQKRAKS